MLWRKYNIINIKDWFHEKHDYHNKILYLSWWRFFGSNIHKIGIKFVYTLLSLYPRSLQIILLNILLLLLYYIIIKYYYKGQSLLKNLIVVWSNYSKGFYHKTSGQRGVGGIWTHLTFSLNKLEENIIFNITSKLLLLLPHAYNGLVKIEQDPNMIFMWVSHLNHMRLSYKKLKY